MKFISHRGNIRGREKETENLPRRVEECLEMGFEVEVDVWCVNGDFFLGHDKPEHYVPINFLRREGLWCHAKNSEAFTSLVRDPNVHCFWHQEDDYTITSRGIVWVYPGKSLTESAICVMPELANYSIDEMLRCQGLCSDNVIKYSELLSQ